MDPHTMTVIIAGFTLFNVIVTVIGLSAANRAAAHHNAARELRDDAHKSAGLIIGAFDSYRQGATDAVQNRRRVNPDQRCRMKAVTGPPGATFAPGMVCVRPMGHQPPHADTPMAGDIYPPCEHRPDARLAEKNVTPCPECSGRTAP